MNLKRIFASLVLLALALGFIAPAPAQAVDRVKIIYGHLCWTDHTFGFVATPDGDAWTFDEEAWKKHCAGVSNAGANAIRILPYAVWDPRPLGRRSQFSPWVLEISNNWNLAKFNARYFAIMRRAIEIANSYNLTVWYAWFDQCQLYSPWSAYSPWKHNIQGVSSFLDAAADPYTKAWIKKVVAEFGDLDVLWPWGNELANSKAALNWVRRVVFPLIRELNIPFDKMTYGFTMDERTYLSNGKFADKPDTEQDIARKYLGMDFPPESNKYKVLREVHKCGTLALDSFCPYGHRPAQAAYWWGNKPAVGPWVLSDDGVHENRNAVDGGRPDAARWKAMATWALGLKNAPHLEHLPEGGNLEYQVGVIAGISAAYKARFGKWPENYGKWHYEPPIVPPEYVTVTICKGSGLLPNPYCPETASQKYVKGTEPKNICTVHKKPEPPPIEYEDIAVCAASRLLPNPYCPTIVIEKFVKGQGPTTACEIHKKPVECGCSGWFKKGDFKRWWDCVFGDGPKHCK